MAQESEQPPSGRHPRRTQELPQQSKQPPAGRHPRGTGEPAARVMPRGPVARFVAPGPATRLTARGAVVAMFWLFFLGAMAAGWLNLGVLTGLTFAAGCALAARYTRRDGLLAVVASPPVIFIIVLLITEALTTHAASTRRWIESVAEGTFLTLAGVAPWLFGGVAVGLAIAMARGLPQCFRDLSAELRGEQPGPARTTRVARPG